MATKPSRIDSGVPIHSIETERAVLCCCMLDNTAVVRTSQLRPEHFYDARHVCIFRAIKDLSREGVSPDILTVSDKLKATGDLDKAGGDLYIIGLTNDLATGVNIERYAKDTVVKAALRGLIVMASAVPAKIVEFQNNPDELMGWMVGLINRIQSGLIDGRELDFLTLLGKVKDDIDSADLAGRAVSLISSGYSGLDRMTGGFGRGELSCIAADPSIGKSDWMRDLGLNIGRSDASVGIVSLEESELVMGRRFFSTLTGTDSLDLRRGTPNTYQRQLLQDYAALGNRKIYMDFSPRATALDIRAVAHRWKAKYDLGILFIDNLTRVRRIFGGNKLEGIEDVLEEFDRLSRELDIAVVVLHHLNRTKEVREKNRPVLSNLDYAGDRLYRLVIMLWRKSHQKEADIDDMEVLVRKASNGRTGQLNMRYHLPSGEIREWLAGEKPPEDSDNNPKESNDYF